MEAWGLAENIPSSRRRRASLEEAKIILLLTGASSGDLSPVSNNSYESLRWPIIPAARTRTVAF